MTTSRRKFLSTVSAVTAGGLAALSSRAPRFLLESAAYGAVTKGERILVVVQLSGGNDGLNTVVPYSEEKYRKSRPSLVIDGNGGNIVKIENGIGLHPSLKAWEKLLENKQLSILQGIGYPNPNRSHFESMDIWHTAHTKPSGRDSGWLGRCFDAHKDTLAKAIDPPGMHLGEEVQPLALAARDLPAPSIRSLEQFRLETGGDDQQRSVITCATAAPRAEGNDLLKFVQTRATSALDLSRRMQASGSGYKTTVNYPGTPLAQKLKNIAHLIDAGLTTRVYYVSIDGFDTHSDQAGAHASLLDQVGGAIAAFTEDLAGHGQLDRVMTLVFSEFGRRLQENASRGTDHGAAAPVFLLGNKVKPGLIGKHPSLHDLDDGDVKFHTDFRSIYAALLEKWLGWPAAPILGDMWKPMECLA
ncbi:MAG: DUF1501 domain-containing protein [Pirellulaceae bacterium]